MPETAPVAGRRTWAWLVGAVALLFFLMIAFAMWSEREDAQRLPAEETQPRGEETWAPDPATPSAPTPDN
jgi:uncharacterized iron-regulated membrane protein